MLIMLLKKLNKNALEKTLCNMAKTMVQGRLDLSTEAAKPIKAMIDNVLRAYADDFPKPAVVTSPAINKWNDEGTDSGDIDAVHRC